MNTDTNTASVRVDAARRQWLALLGSSSLLGLAGCGGGSGSTTADTNTGLPRITTAPASATVREGRTYTLTVEASGPGLSYQWKRNGNPIQGASGQRLQRTATLGDQGASFSVVVSNATGQVESPSAVLSVSSGGTLSLLAGGLGTGSAAQPGAVDGEGAQARFANMGPCCLDPAGNLYVMDVQAATLRKVSPTGITTTMFTGFPVEGGLAVDAQGNFYGVRNRTIVRVSPSGVQQTWAGQAGVLGYADGPGATASFANPKGLTFDQQGNLLVCDASQQSYEYLSPYITYTYGSTIRRITPTGVVSTVAGVPGRIFRDFDYWTQNPISHQDVTFLAPKELATDASGRVWVLDVTGVRLVDLASNTAVWLVKEHFTTVTSMSLLPGSSGDLCLARGNVISVLSAEGIETVVAGVAGSTTGVQLGALPARLGPISSMACVTDDVWQVCSENAVLRLQRG